MLRQRTGNNRVCREVRNLEPLLLGIRPGSAPSRKTAPMQPGKSTSSAEAQETQNAPEGADAQPRALQYSGRAGVNPGAQGETRVNEGTHEQRSKTQPQRKMKSCDSLEPGWNWTGHRAQQVRRNSSSHHRERKECTGAERAALPCRNEGREERWAGGHRSRARGLGRSGRADACI